MPTDLTPLALLFCFCASVIGPVLAQEQEQPLSVIDWLDQNIDPASITAIALPSTGTAPGVTDEPNADISVTPLEQEAGRLIGIVPARVTGLSEDLWSGSAPATLSDALRNVPDLRLPAAQDLLYLLLLSEASGPGDDIADEDLLTLARVDVLRRFGALDPAMALLDQAGATRDAAHFAAYMDIALLSGSEDEACARLTALPHLAPSIEHRVFCAARAGQWNTAALLLDTGKAVGIIPQAEANALDRFLDPELFDGADPLPVPRTMTPLLFRVHEALGEPLPTRILPRAYAVADLRDLAGWKAQLEAAERLALSGALSGNRLLGLYTERQPAASGGIWDRVDALQRFETALSTGSPEAVSKTLPQAWRMMQDAGLEVVFAELFAVQTAPFSLTGPAAAIARTMQVLTGESLNMQGAAGISPLVLALSQGAPLPDPSSLSDQQAAIAAAFQATLPASSPATDTMGAAILEALTRLDAGTAGDLPALEAALFSLRALGLDQAARQAAVQTLLLETPRR